VLQRGFGSGFLPLGPGLKSDSKKLESEHICIEHGFGTETSFTSSAAEVAGVTFPDSDSAPVPKF